jgi:pimeloyl-ACP methyl ester carboxylesterase
VVVIGTSRGGLIAMLMAATHRDRLAGVVLNDIGPVLEPAGLLRIRRYLGKAPALHHLARRGGGAQAHQPGI